MTILISDPRVVGIPLREIDEPVVDLLDLAPDAVGLARLVRRGVRDRLLAAARTLPDGIGLKVVEGSRASGAQRAIIESYSERLRQDRPAATPEQILHLTSRHVAPLQTAPHVAGAAVDVTLVGADGRELWMGSALDATPEQSAGACYTGAPGLDATARAHRAMLVTALEATGLVNYPTEWWHWSYGDRYWAHVTGAEHAIYGPLPMTAAA
jgi:D-alanyl-D-alanine dipeptidase